MADLLRVLGVVPLALGVRTLSALRRTRVETGADDAELQDGEARAESRTHSQVPAVAG
jgi:hypothetical protein